MSGNLSIEKRSELTILSGPQEAYLLEPESVTEDVSLTASALLYSDHVHLYSMTAGELQWYANATNLGPVELAEFLLWVEENNREMTLDSTGMAKREWLKDFVRASRNGNRKQRRAAEKHHRFIRQDAERLLEQNARMWEIHGGSQLDHAVSAGALTIHTDWVGDVITRPDEIDEDKMLEIIRGQVGATGGAIMFDSLMGDLVSAAERERFLPLEKRQQVGIRRTKTGTAMISFLPAFPGASIVEVLESRKIIQAPLDEYRLAVVQLETMLQLEDGDSHVDNDALEDLWHDYVEPRVSKVIEALNDTSLSRSRSTAKSGLFGAASPCAAFFVTEVGAAVPGIHPEDIQRVVDLAASAGMPDLSTPLAAGVASSITAVTGARLGWKSAQRRRDLVRNNDLVYLADTQRALAKRKK